RRRRSRGLRGRRGRRVAASARPGRGRPRRRGSSRPIPWSRWPRRLRGSGSWRWRGSRAWGVLYFLIPQPQACDRLFGMYPTVLVALDGSTNAEKVLPLVEPVLKACKGKAVLLQVLPEGGVGPEAAARAYLREI